jgi:hypothetical protein
MYNYMWLSIVSALILSCVFLSHDLDCYGDVRSNNNLRNKTAFNEYLENIYLHLQYRMDILKKNYDESIHVG